MYERLDRAEAEQLVILDRYTAGVRELAVVPCICAAGQEVARRWRNLPPAAEGITLSTRLVTIPDEPTWEEARSTISAFVANPRGWLTLAGNYGTGKTHLVYACLNELAARGIGARYTTLPELLAELRRAIKLGCYDEQFERLQRTPILAIDEVDKYRSDTEWPLDVIETLFLRRYRESEDTGTILVYNRDRSERLPPFLRSRMQDAHFHFVELTGKDLREDADLLDPWDRGEGEARPRSAYA